MSATKLLGVFAKQPQAGQNKTRLAATTSDVWALRVASAFLHDTLDRCANIEAQRVVVYAPEQAGAYFACLAASAMHYGRKQRVTSVLAERVFPTACTLPDACAIALGADSPTLPLGYVDQALQRCRVMTWYLVRPWMAAIT